MSEMNLMSLQAQLINFGLNPLEWRMSRAHGPSFLLQHLEDADFSMEGEIEFKSAQPRWKFLKILSF